MTATQATNPPDAPRPVRWTWLRLGLLIVGLLILNTLMADGARELFLQQRGAPGFRSWMWLLFFGMGWDAFSPILLGLWLAWGGGRLVLRLALVLCVTAAEITIPLALFSTPLARAWEMGYQSLLGEFLMYSVLIFSIQLIMLPLRGWLGWQLGFAPPPELAKSRRGAKWSVFDVMGYTAFAAFALAFVRLLDLWMTNIGNEQGDNVWLIILLEFAMPVAGTSAAALVILLEGFSWRWRLAAIPLTMLAFFACQFGYRLALGLPPSGQFDAATMALGTVLAPFLNFALLRLAGVRLWRRAESAAAST